MSHRCAGREREFIRKIAPHRRRRRRRRRRGGPPVWSNFPNTKLSLPPCRGVRGKQGKGARG